VTAHTAFTAAELLRLDQEHRPRQRLAKRLLASYPPYRRTVEAGPFLGAEAVIVHTAAAREQMLRRGVAPERVHVVPAGTPPALPAGPEEVESLRRRFGLEGRRVLTVFGYVNPDKGYEVALEALAGLPPAVKLLIAGGTRVEHEQAYMHQLRETIRARALEERVAITGFLQEPEIAAAMALSDLVLVPHTAANGSYSVMVALSYGKPVLASDLACFSEIRADAECLELFPAGDERSLAERVGFLLASAGARRRLAESAAAYAARRSWKGVAETTAGIYRQALAGTR
jgi:glycosyltransferase involved in cell wall biosynthesis